MVSRRRFKLELEKLGELSNGLAIARPLGQFVIVREVVRFWVL